MFSSRKKKHTSAPASGLAPSRVSQQLQLPTNWQSQSQLQSPQEKQRSPPVTPWSAHAPPFGQSPSPFLRNAYALSTSATATGELFLFGGFVHGSKSPSNELYVFSTQDFSTTLLQTSGDAPSPRYGHRAVLTSTTLLIWGGRTDFSDQNARHKCNDDSVYMLNLLSRKWTRVTVNGPSPGSRCYHTMKLIGSKLFVFGGASAKRYFNDMWALDLNSLKSNPFWEPYKPAPGSKKPLPRDGHVSVATSDRIIIFGGCDGSRYLNDTWSFNISTGEWTELQCTGSIPSPRAIHAGVLVGDVIYVFGGYDGTHLGDLTAFNLSTKQWTPFQNIGQSPCRRRAHAMASDGRRVFLLGGELSPGAQVDEAKVIHVLDTKILIYPKPDANTAKRSEKTTQLLSADHLTQGQAQHGKFSSSDAGVTQRAVHIQKSASEDMGRPSPQITRERRPSLNGPPSRPMGASVKSIRVPEGDDGGEGSPEHHARLVTPDAPSLKEIAQIKHGRLFELERQLSEMVVAKTERDQRIAQLTDELALMSALLEQAAEDKKRAGLEQRGLQAKLDESLLSRDRALEQAQSAFQKATFRAAETNERSQPAREHGTELAEVHGKLEARQSELAAVRLRLTDAEVGWAKSKAEADILRAQIAAGSSLDYADVDRVVRYLMQHMRTMNDKRIEETEWNNEGPV